MHETFLRRSGTCNVLLRNLRKQGCAKRVINQTIERESELRYGVHRIGRIPPVDNSLNWVCCSPRDKEMSFTEDDHHLSELSGHDAGGMTGSEADSE